ncbi:hypothetical protein AOR_1_2714174 [Paecilomyces variotii No. 5]|uniref:Uncharacterized protein n=1 Tax=Byssochlamys spectabilis (strain No. 5 / NBRC 109023) TaxID=1356009 RepID=V5FXU4_BYSSN|nr:hypothetical protein AOR_1_2714174 [Paecilomyces variotii No. 5]
MASDSESIMNRLRSTPTRRKRRNSSISSLNHDYNDQPDLDRKAAKAVTRSNTRRNKEISNEESAGNASCQTPRRRSKKKVRFSDPGPQLQPFDEASTGLTPAILRTSFEECDITLNETYNRTPSRRRQRRQSAPLEHTQSLQDPAFPIEFPPAPRMLQFTPLRQILDERTQRRIRRIGMSEEIDDIQREKREKLKGSKEMLRQKDLELATLKEELEAVKNARVETEKHDESGESPSDSKRRIAELEAEVSRLRREISQSTTGGWVVLDREAYHEGDTVMTNGSVISDDTILISSSSDLRAHYSREFGAPPSPASTSDTIPITTDASAHASIVDPRQEAEMVALSLDLAAAKQEKRDLFNEWRAHINPPSQDDNNDSRPSSPPPDFMYQIVPTLKATLTRASEASSALESVRNTLADMGFSGGNTDEVIAELRQRFRSARLELERAVPGETPSVGLEDGFSTLNALVERVKRLANDLEREKQLHEGTIGREKALRGQFDVCLLRYEAASKKIHDLEETIDSSAGDMLHARMRIQELERRGNDQAVGIDRLNAALDKYHEEVRGLEKLITSMEAEAAASKEGYKLTILTLENKVKHEETARRLAESAAAEHVDNVRELQDIVEQNQIRVCDLTAKVESLERERNQVVEAMENNAVQQLELHDQEIGSMNVRLSELTTSLEDAKSEAEKLRRLNASLEERLQAEIEAQNRLADKWAADQARSFAYMKEAINAERRGSKVRAANWKIMSDDLESEATMLGSEPITPVSMTRFVDVEVGRGKHRRRIDSGVGFGVLTEEELEDDDDASQACISSEPDLPGLAGLEETRTTQA